MESGKRKRKTKVSHEQKQIYCQYLERCPALAQKFYTDDPTVVSIWTELTMELNKVMGARHSAEDWKTVFDNWRYAVTYKYRIAEERKQKNPKKEWHFKSMLELLEEKAMRIWSSNGNLKKNISIEFANVEEVEVKEEMIVPDEIVKQNEKPQYPLQRLPEKVLKDNTQKRLEQKQDELNDLTKPSEPSQTNQLDEINHRLGQIVENLDNLSSAQNRTADALERLVEILSNGQA